MTNLHASQILPLIDLTSLNLEDNETAIHNLCQKALANPEIASVCIFPKFICLVKKYLNTTAIKISTVANFPKGNTPLKDVLSEIKTAIDMGVDEIDVVIPYEAYLNQEETDVVDFTHQCVKACNNQVTLKTIIETGALQQDIIEKASKDVIAGKTNFVKTSTGKVSKGASLEAVDTILKVIKRNDNNVGIKISGGIQTVQQALDYLNLIEKEMSHNWISSKTVRFGTSKLLDNLACLRG